jgi:hypothetical protein
MGNHRKAEYVGGFLERKIDAGVLWKEGSVDFNSGGVREHCNNVTMY